MKTKNVFFKFRAEYIDHFYARRDLGYFENGLSQG